MNKLKLSILAFSIFSQIKSELHQENIERLLINKDNALPLAKKAVDEFLFGSSTLEKENFAKFLTYYRSYYQAVTPPPYELRNSLTKKTKKIIEKIKNYAKVFLKPQAKYDIPKEEQDDVELTAPESLGFFEQDVEKDEIHLHMVGSSKLTQDGENFYQNLVRYVKNKLKAK